MNNKIFIVSDSTGDTAEKIVSAALRQFDAQNVNTEIFSLIRSDDEIEEVIQRAADQEALIAHTMVDSQQRTLLQNLCSEADIDEIDLIGPLMGKLATLLSAEAKALPGGLHAVNAEYFRRIEAVEFAVKNDDGQHPRNLRKSDIVLVGISRTSKTPLSTYLAQRGYKVANVPLVMGIEPPKELFEIDQRRIFALSIDSRALFRIRQSRLQSLGMPADTSYGMRDHIDKEIQYANQIFEANPHWPLINVTDRAIEETAAELSSLRKKMMQDDPS